MFFKILPAIDSVFFEVNASLIILCSQRVFDQLCHIPGIKAHRTYLARAHYGCDDSRWLHEHYGNFYRQGKLKSSVLRRKSAIISGTTRRSHSRQIIVMSGPGHRSPHRQRRSPPPRGSPRQMPCRQRVDSDPRVLPDQCAGRRS